MCRWRQIQDTYLRCNHIFRHPDEMVFCLGPKCKFSPNHAADCANCSITCWQYRQFPEQIDRQLNRFCPKCQAMVGDQT